MRRLADGIQLQVARQGLKVVVILAHRRARLQPFRLGRRTARANLDLDQFGSCSHVTYIFYRVEKPGFALRFSPSAFSRVQLLWFLIAKG